MHDGPARNIGFGGDLEDHNTRLPISSPVVRRLQPGFAAFLTFFPQPLPPRRSTMERHHLMSGGRYPVLRTIGIFYLIGGAVTVLAGLFFALWTLVGPAVGWLGMEQGMSFGERLLYACGLLAGTFFAALTMYAIAEVIKLFIDMSNSLRLMACNVPGMTTTTATTMAREGEVMVTTEAGGHRNRLSFLDDETAEAALIKGH
jgi:hypothetical protein